MSEPQRGLILGYPFDQLFDRECGLEYWKDYSLVPALKLPGNESPGTGNIVISGPPGSGKSTLAMQWAVRCALRKENRSNAAYISLETTVDEIISKAKPFGWHGWLREARFLNAADEFGGADNLAGDLKDLLLGVTKGISLHEAGERRDIDNPSDDGGDPTRRVLLFSVSPRPLTSATDHDELFWRRYSQLERLLAAAQHLTPPSSTTGSGNPEPNLAGARGSEWNRILPLKRNKKTRLEEYSEGRYISPGAALLPLVVIDSLNMFGTRPLSREEIFRLFSLFRKYERIGVFVVESTQDTPFDSTMAEVVVSLTSQKDRGYLVQHFEIEKSRYCNQVKGLHPISINLASCIFLGRCYSGLHDGCSTRRLGGIARMVTRGPE